MSENNELKLIEITKEDYVSYIKSNPSYYFPGLGVVIDPISNNVFMMEILKKDRWSYWKVSFD